jgi:hypothetical protein
MAAEHTIMTDSDCDTPTQPRKRARQCENTKPTAVKDYKGAWGEALKVAKQKFRRFIILYNAFPVRHQHLHKASQTLAYVIADMKSRTQEKIVFSPGNLKYY